LQGALIEISTIHNLTTEIDQNSCSKLVQVVRENWHCDLDMLALADLQDHLFHFAALLHAIAGQVIPMVENALWEGLTTGLLTQGSHETKGLGNGEVGLGLNEWCALSWVLLKDHATTQIQCVVHTTHHILRACDFNKENGFLQSGGGCQLRSKANSACGRHQLTCTTMDRVGVERDILDVEADAAHVFLAKWALFSNPLEARVHVLLDLVQILHSLRFINDQVRTLSLRAIAPDLECRIVIPVILFLQNLFLFLDISLP